MPHPKAGPLVLGTRGSPLALAQAEEAARRLRDAHGALRDADALRIEVVRTTGDRVTEGPLADLGGKGLFTKELDDALLDGRIDFAVHSLKDVPTFLPRSIVIAAVLPREDPRDALFTRGPTSLRDLPRGAVVGTVSLRRAAQVKAMRPDLEIAVLRGNVHTRIDKLAAGAVDATLLAVAGLKRLGIAHRATSVLQPDELLPAVGQGAVAVTCRADDAGIMALLAPLDDPATTIRVAAERTMLAILDGTCRTPIAGLATFSRDGALTLKGLVAKPDGSKTVRAEDTGTGDDPIGLGRRVGEMLLRDAGPGFLDGWR